MDKCIKLVIKQIRRVGESDLYQMIMDNGDSFLFNGEQDVSTPQNSQIQSFKAKDLLHGSNIQLIERG